MSLGVSVNVIAVLTFFVEMAGIEIILEPLLVNKLLLGQ